VIPPPPSNAIVPSFKTRCLVIFRLSDMQWFCGGH
jgi:hypothetical protein